MNNAAEQFAYFQRVTESGDFIDLPHKCDRGWTVNRFSSVDAARFFETRKDLAMPAWDRFAVIDGKLKQVN